MSSRIAVVTDAVSEKHIFPIWYSYYSNLFGSSSLFVVTYAGLSPLFAEFKLGGVIELPVGYDDATRRSVIGEFVSTLLHCYDTVVRVDADEFLVVDPRTAASLATYLAGLDAPYLTARGFDVVQMPDEPPLQKTIGTSVLANRAFAYPNTALNKTCIARVPIDWCTGFHWASVYPKFGPLFMLHMKRLDMGWQLDWYQRMSKNIKDNPKVDPSIREYYSADEENVRGYHKGVSERPRVSGIDSWYREDLTRDFLQKIEFVPKTGLYHGSFGHELVLCEIPPEWKAVI